MNVVPPVYLTMVCLANSRKHGGRCVAGKVLDDPSGPYWIRPVSARPDGSLSPAEIRLTDGTCPRLLDILEVPVKHYTLTDYQSENICIDARHPWKKIGRFTPSLDNLTDNVSDVWLRGSQGCKGINDRIPVSEVDTLHNSLVLIKPSSLVIRVVNGFGKKAVRARFYFKSTWYDLRVTDPEVEAYYLERPLGSERVAAAKCHLCISLGVAFEGYIYKLVAGIPGLLGT